MAAVEQIADELGLQGWSSTPDFIPLELTRELLHDARAAQAEGRFRIAGVGGRDQLRVDALVRGDATLWLDEATTTPAQRACLEHFERLRAALNRELQLGLFELEAHCACYPPGAFYRRHTDRPLSSDARIISCVLYLNEDWVVAQGGALRLYLSEDSEPVYRDFYPEAGRLVIFFSERFWHEVLPTQRERHSVTAWFSRR